jgi:hypothetical protein
LYEQICPNPQPHKPAKDKKYNREKKGGMKRKKSTTWHLPTSCMHPIKPVTLGLQRVKEGEKIKNERYIE